MKKKWIVNVIGWIFVIFLSICNLYYYEQLKIITSGLGGLICVIIAASLVFYKPKSKV